MSTFRGLVHFWFFQEKKETKGKISMLKYQFITTKEREMEGLREPPHIA